jgi:acyl-CoA dehydrogenase
MDLVVTEEQTLLQRAAKDFVAARSPIARVREGHRGHEPVSRALWREMAGLGWLGLTIPEAHGGTGLGYRFAMVVLEELGRELVPEPLVSTLAGAEAILRGGSKEAMAEHLPAISAGERIVALAHRGARSRFDLASVATAAEARGAGYVLRGEKTQVADATVADLFVVSAEVDGGVALFLVPRAAKGVTVHPQRRVDGRSAAIVRFDGVTLDAHARLAAYSAAGTRASKDRGLALLERVVDVATVALAAEMLGSMGGAFARTLEYLRTRVQFGVPIGSFQALQHRAARVYVETELARSAVMHAHSVLDEPGTSAEDVGRAASVAKAKCSDAFMLVAHEAVQMHGGIGMTDEHDIGLFLKRARVAEMTFGDAAHHRNRYAALSGF